MTTAYTSLLGLALPVTGELSGTWGDTVNNSITSLLDSAVAGTTTLSSDADVTLTTTTGSSNQAREAVILWTAGGTVTRTITAPAQSKTYIVINKTSSSQSIKLVGVGPTTGVTVVASESAICAWNGLDFVKVSSNVASGVTTFQTSLNGLTPSTASSGAVTLAGTLGISSGGTGAITLAGASIATYTGTETLTNKTLTNPTVTNYVETVVAIGNSGTTQTLALTNGTVQTVTMTGNCTFTMPTATAGKSFILICTQDATGSRTAVFTSVKWPAGTAPTLTTTATTGVDIITFVANGTNWYGTYAQAFA